MMWHVESFITQKSNKLGADDQVKRTVYLRGHCLEFPNQSPQNQHKIISTKDSHHVFWIHIQVRQVIAMRWKTVKDLCGIVVGVIVLSCSFMLRTLRNCGALCPPLRGKLLCRPHIQGHIQRADFLPKEGEKNMQRTTRHLYQARPMRAEAKFFSDQQREFFKKGSWVP